MPIFTKEELQSFNTDQLKRLARYFGISYDESRVSRRRLINEIYSKIEHVDGAGNVVPVAMAGDSHIPASVRVQRIRNSKGA